MSKPMVRAVGIKKSFGDSVVLDGVTMDVQRGETVSILGRSGSGKSTLLRCLNMLEVPDRGVVYLDGTLLWYEDRGSHLHELPRKSEAEQRREIGMVFQQFNLFAHMTVIENIMAAPIGVLRRPRAEVHEEARALLKRVGLADKADHLPEQLSGGQQQRVAIARALAMKPKVLLFDEPTSALDPDMVSEVLDVIRDLVEGGMTSIIVTHEIGFAREVSDRFVFMENGVIVESGPTSRLAEGAEQEATQRFLAKVL